jgi:tetratricopeptide (TPR) repeat protein
MLVSRRGPSSPSTKDDDPREKELKILQSEYHNMDITRRTYEDHSHSVLRDQQSTIDRLRKENDSLKSDIAVIMRGSSRPISIDQHEQMQHLNDQGDKYLQAIEVERKNNEILAEQIQIMRNKVFQQRKNMGGVNAPRENFLMIQKQIRILENRLDKSLIKFNEAIAHNKNLRDKIDDLRRERVVFENIYRKIERDLQEKKRAMAEIIEVSNQAYENRDNFQMEIAAIEQANRREREDFDEQMAALGRMMDTELVLPSLTATPSANTLNNSRGQSRSLPRLNSTSNLQNSPSGRVLKTKSAGGLGMGNLGPNSTSPDSKGTGSIAGGEVDYRERVQNFEEAFNKIKAATGINDIDTLVKTFIKNEEHNFSLFNYVNEQNNELEKLEEAIAVLQEEESKFAQESGQDVNQHKEILRDLEVKLSSTDSMAEKYELRCQDLTRILDALKRGMQSIANKLDFSNEHVNSEFAVSKPVDGDSNLPGKVAVESAEGPVVSEVNMVSFLGNFEKKANELLQRYKQVQAFMLNPGAELSVMIHSSAVALGGSIDEQQRVMTPGHMDAATTLATLLGTGPKVPMGADHLHVIPPKADDYRSDDEDNIGLNGETWNQDDDNRPLTRDELKFRTLNRLQRRLHGNTTGNGATTGAALYEGGGDGGAAVSGSGGRNNGGGSNKKKGPQGKK